RRAPWRLWRGAPTPRCPGGRLRQRAPEPRPPLPDRRQRRTARRPPLCGPHAGGRRRPAHSRARPDVGDARSADLRLPPAAGFPLSRRVGGPGPFQLVSAERGEQLVLAPNPGYPDGVPKLHSLVVRILPDEVVRVLELQRGGVHLVEDAPEPEMVTWLGTVPTLLVRRAPGTSFVYLALNLRDPRLADRRVREAITLALDREGLLRFVLGGAARPATGLPAPEHWAYAPTRPPQHDPRRARR